MEAQERTRQKLAAAIKEEMEHTSLDHRHPDCGAGGRHPADLLPQL